MRLMHAEKYYHCHHRDILICVKPTWAALYKCQIIIIIIIVIIIIIIVIIYSLH